MADSTADDSSGDDATQPEAEADLAAAVDDAMKLEIKRQRARFVQQIIGLDRGEGVGRREERRDDHLYRDLGMDRPEDPAG